MSRNILCSPLRQSSVVLSTMTVNHRTLHLPCVLCLHGGGINVRIFKASCRRIMAQLDSEFRFFFAEAAFLSDAGSDVLLVYSQWGPFKRWLRWLSEHLSVSPAIVAAKLEYQVAEAMHQDNERGGSVKWVALLCFSQGNTIAASLLYRQQLREEAKEKHHVHSDFWFSIFDAGRAPLVSLNIASSFTPALPSAAEILDPLDLKKRRHDRSHVLQISTLDVHRSLTITVISKNS
jgi:hypothetical protein